MVLNSATVWTYLFLHLGVILVVTAYYTLGAAVAPALTERARVRFARRPWLPLVAGFAISVPWVVIALILMNLDAGVAKFLGVVLGCLWILCGLIGGAGVAQHVGRGDAEVAPTWVHSVRGGLFITMTWVLPLVGWMVMLPLTLAAGVGCLALSPVPLRAAPAHPELAGPAGEPST